MKKDLGKPGEFGWAREVVRSQVGGHVTAVNYLTPPHPLTGARSRVKRLKDIEAHLTTSCTNGLTASNFVFTDKVLGLPLEVERRAITPGTNKSPYSRFVRELEGAELVDGRRKVGCTLCPSTVALHTFSQHMRKEHLPAAECEACGEEFPALTIGTHRKVCATGRGPGASGKGEQSAVIATSKKESMQDTSLASSKADCAAVKSEVLPPSAALSIDLDFKYGGKKFKVSIGQGKKMRKALKVMAKKVGKEVEKLRFTVRATGALVTGGDAVEQYGEASILIQDTA